MLATEISFDENHIKYHVNDELKKCSLDKFFKELEKSILKGNVLSFKEDDKGYTIDIIYRGIPSYKLYINKNTLTETTDYILREFMMQANEPINLAKRKAAIFKTKFYRDLIKKIKKGKINKLSIGSIESNKFFFSDCDLTEELHEKDIQSDIEKEAIKDLINLANNPEYIKKAEENSLKMPSKWKLYIKSLRATGAKYLNEEHIFKLFRVSFWEFIALGTLCSIVLNFGILEILLSLVCSLAIGLMVGPFLNYFLFAGLAAIKPFLEAIKNQKYNLSVEKYKLVAAQKDRNRKNMKKAPVIKKIVNYEKEIPIQLNYINHIINKLSIEEQRGILEELYSKFEEYKAKISNINSKAQSKLTEYDKQFLNISFYCYLDALISRINDRLNEMSYQEQMEEIKSVLRERKDSVSEGPLLELKKQEY